MKKTAKANTKYYLEVAEVLRRMQLPEDIELTDHEMIMATQLVLPDEGVDWDEIGGCRELLSEFRKRVILPLRLKHNNTLPASRLCSPAKGILLYGPPGCGKTLIARAVAKAVAARFVHFDLSILTDKYYGESQKMTAALFSFAKKVQPCIIFIDEIDAFLRERQSTDHEGTAMMKSQFMSLWDGFFSSDDDIIVMGATNRPQDVDNAILRRMPMRFYVPKPDESSRVEILRVILRHENASENINYGRIASVTQNFSGSDLKEVCRLAALYRLHEASENGPERVTANDLTIREEDLLRCVQRYTQSLAVPSVSNMLIDESVD
ncbi:Protein MSPN-1 a [Aphelenchoides avenae]|nr:Protein MSPN-1 a [Aphelenchus avenae]